MRDHVVQAGWNQQVGDALKILHQFCLGSLTHFISNTSIFDYFFQRRLNNVKDNKLFSQTNVFPGSWIATYWSTTMSRLDHVLCSPNFEWLGVLYFFWFKNTSFCHEFRQHEQKHQPSVYTHVYVYVFIYTYIAWRLLRPWITAGKSFLPFFWGNQFFEPSLFIVALFLGRTWKDPIHTKLHGTQVRQGAMGRSEEGRCGSLAVRPWDQRIGTCLCDFFSGQDIASLAQVTPNYRLAN